MAGKVVSLHTYPVKSLRGLSWDSLAVEIDGPVGDREFVIVDENGRFLTQRQIPKMALISVRKDGETLRFSSSVSGSGVDVDLASVAGEADVTVWSDTLRAAHIAGADAFLSAELGRSVRLFRYMPSHLRVQPSPTGNEFTMRFPDSAQILLTTEESRLALSAAVGFEMPGDRFRANVVVSGFPAWSEESWKHVRIGEMEFDVMKKCTRCKIITIDQATGEVGSPEPLLALKNVVKGDQAKSLFGVMLQVSAPGALRVGDRVEFWDAR